MVNVGNDWPYWAVIVMGLLFLLADKLYPRQEVTVRHLKIFFMDEHEEELESRWSYIVVGNGVLQMNGDNRSYGMGREVGPAYPLVNIKKYEWVEGYK